MEGKKKPVNLNALRAESWVSDVTTCSWHPNFVVCEQMLLLFREGQLCPWKTLHSHERERECSQYGNRTLLQRIANSPDCKQSDWSQPFCWHMSESKWVGQLGKDGIGSGASTEIYSLPLPAHNMTLPSAYQHQMRFRTTAVHNMILLACSSSLPNCAGLSPD